MYDIIGDIHGHAEALQALLAKLGYNRRNDVFRFPQNRRTVVFVGDFIDRGPQIRQAVEIVRAMLEAGSAVAVAGNHEYNALAYHSKSDSGRFLRDHNERHVRQHSATLQQYERFPDQLRSDLAWMRTLPLFLETPHMRVVHAAWVAGSIGAVQSTPRALENNAFFQASARPGTEEFTVVEHLLKGVEVPLPPGVTYRDKENIPRRNARIRWWMSSGSLGNSGSRDRGSEMASTARKVPTWKQFAMPPVDSLPDQPVPEEYLFRAPGYDWDKPVFFGHYWLKGRPHLLASKIACLDFSVAAGGVLAAYRFDGEPELNDSRFVWVEP